MGSFDLWWQDETDKSWTRSGAIPSQLYSFSLPKIWDGKSSSVDHSWLGLGRELINSCWGRASLALLSKLPAWGTVLVISEIFSWIFSPLWLCRPFIASLHSEWFTACMLLSSQPWESVERSRLFTSNGDPAGRLLDLRLSLHTENMGAFNRTTEGAFMALRANQEGGCIGSAIWIHSERNEFCPVWVFCLIKGKTKSSWAGVWRKALAKVSLTGYFSQLSQSGSPSWWRDNCTLPCTMMRQLVKERNPFTVYFIRCMCRSLERREELTVTEAHLTVGGATELRDVHSSHPAPFPSAWLHVLSGELRLIVLSVLLTVHSVWKFVWVTSPGLEAMDGGSSMFYNWFWSQGRSPCSYTAGS